MDLKELQQKLDEMGVPKYWYSIEEDIDGPFVIKKYLDKWIVYMRDDYRGKIIKYSEFRDLESVWDYLQFEYKKFYDFYHKIGI